MATKNLAKKLGVLRQRSQNSSESKKSLISNQIFSYLIVIDFESTCWREKNNYRQEIIEFPAVVLNTSTGEVESEFHTYVQPQEHPILSEFCTELTGITQVQVEAGIPLQICLSQFTRWLQNLQHEKGVTFPNKQQTCSSPLPSQKPCTFLTWSDWDLGVCLQYECKRKQLHKPEVFNSWIDLRSTYRLFYNKKPKGLNGALQDLGIQFSGREHSGLDDARNTARLAARMMRDGCIMTITRSLERTPVMAKAMFGNNTCPEVNEVKKANIRKKENMLTSELLSSNIPFKDGRKRSCSKNIPRSLDSKENASSVPTCHSLISPKTLLNNSKETLWGQSSRINAAQTAASHSATFTVNSSHVLCSTTVSCFSHLPQSNQTFQTGLLDEKEDTEVLVEAEERCSSYDDVVLERDDANNETDKEWYPESVSDFDSEYCEWDDHSHTSEVNVTLEDNVGRVSTKHNPRMQNNVSNSSLVSKSIRTKEIKQHSTMFESKTTFAVPHVIDWGQLNQSNTGHLASPQLQLKLAGPHKSVQTNIVSSVWSKPFRPENTSTPNISTTRHKLSITKHSEPLKSPFTVYTETKKQATGFSHPSPQTPNNILSSSSTNTLSSCASRKGPQKITSPLCACGRRAKRQVVTNGGPNQGRGFYCCPVRRSGGRGRMEKGCEFFKWESALMKGSSVDLSSISLYQMNSTLPHLAPTRKSY